MMTKEEFVKNPQAIETVALELSHSSISTQRIINHPQEVTAKIDGKYITFLPSAISLRLPKEDQKSDSQDYVWQFDDVQLKLLPLVNTIAMGSDVQAQLNVYFFWEELLANYPEPSDRLTLTINSVSWQNYQVTARAIGVNYNAIAVPTQRYLVDDFPGLSYANNESDSNDGGVDYSR